MTDHLPFLKFKATIDIIGINPFVFVPETVLQKLFLQAGKEKGAIPVIMSIDGHEFQQNLVKYSGEWRLYLNQPMRTAAGKEVGEAANFGIRFDSSDRTIPVHPRLKEALNENKKAKDKFDSLPPSLRKEIVRYFTHLKTEETIEKNVLKAIDFLLGKGRFAGRDPS